MFRKFVPRSKGDTETRLPATQDLKDDAEPYPAPGVQRDNGGGFTSGSFGLHIVHQPEKLFGDVVFVHGLGGSSYKTWRWDREDSDSFWPAWLADCDPSLASFRVSTFGYNAQFKGSAIGLDIIDFAQDLLFELNVAFDVGEQSRSRPIIFIVHSLGGLVVKKAFAMGKHDEQYKGLTARIRGIIFLATPHWGSQYAKTLNNILSVAPIGTSSKAYVAALASQSSTIQDINERFQMDCEDVQLCSFFETQKTRLGVRKILVVDRDSALLGHPNEQSLSMDADHHSICKYETRQSANFLKVKNTLLLWTALFLKEYGPPVTLATSDSAKLERSIQNILGVEAISFDISTPPAKELQDCGAWLSENDCFRAWIADEGTSLFMLVGLPGTGKTAILRSMSQCLQALDVAPQCFFFDESTSKQCTTSYCLRLLAAQLALANAEYHTLLSEQHETSKASFKDPNHGFLLLWDRLFADLLPRLKNETPIFWVIDGLNEADEPLPLLSKLMSLPSALNIKILISCRPLKGIQEHQAPRMTTYMLKPTDTIHDMGNFVDHAIKHASSRGELLQELVRSSILAKAGGSFLWAKLVLELIQDRWHSRDQIVAALNEVPRGMASAFTKMMHTFEEQDEETKNLGRQILLWIACSRRPLLLTELEEALAPDFGRLMNLGTALPHISGNFATINDSDPLKPTAVLIHATAKDFLLGQRKEPSRWIDSNQAHEKIAKALLSYLCAEDWRAHFRSHDFLSAAGRVSVAQKAQNRLISTSQRFPLLPYAIQHWAYHFSKSTVAENSLLEAVEKFLLNHALTWAEGIALTGDMSSLVLSAQHMRGYIRRSSQSGVDLRWLQLWATDFIRIVSKFAENMILSPASIYRNVPQMCPLKSIIRQTYGGPTTTTLTVTGAVPETWDDCIGTVSIMSSDTMRQVLATDAYFFVLNSTCGKISVWNTATCEHTGTLDHDEYVFKMTLSPCGRVLAAASFSSYYVWGAISGRLLKRIPHQKGLRIQDIRFSRNSQQLLILHPTGIVEYVDIVEDIEPQRSESNQDKGKEIATGNPPFRKLKRLDLSELLVSYDGCPAHAVFSPDGKQVAAAWRGKPPLVWDIEDEGGLTPVKCRSMGFHDSLMNPEQLAWRGNTGSLLILCHNMNLLVWDIFTDEVTEFPIRAREMSVSDDGGMLITSDHQCTIGVYTFPDMTLIYSLRNDDDTVIGMSFSPNNQRFYELRGSSCHVWEPEALVQPDELYLEDKRDDSGDTCPQEPPINEFSKDSWDITALAASPFPTFYVCGRKDGAVGIHEADTGRKVRSVSQHKTRVTKLAWSPSGKYIVSCDWSSNVLVKRLRQKEHGRWAVFPCFELRLGNPARQVIFDDDEPVVLIATDRKDFVIDLKNKVRLHSRTRHSSSLRHWMRDPNHPGTLLRVGPAGAAHWNLATGEEVGDADEPEEPKTANLDTAGFPVLEPGGPSPATSTEPPSPITWSCEVNSGRHRLVALSTHDRPYQSAYHFGVKMKLLPLTSADASQINLNTALEVPREVTALVKLLLGAIANKVLFLGTNGWVHSYDVSHLLAGTSPLVTKHGRIRGLSRHFYVPKNWFNGPRAHLITMGSGRTLLCPVPGGVVLVKNGQRI